ncbi:MAG TPA: tetratricopeptide repeat protein [Intrasporangium sp.]|uniref:tetratricopeptide repeat protein n=1 Tax=Intrasporangium sp. TaxID=1925024 RepID=UPI002D7915C6|nr:tetratricopeptide repeat protein [Intrasporangium sp.]HET7399344.1 tetratricopeptide repeat protein [Intrasporangium sp.]
MTLTHQQPGHRPPEPTEPLRPPALSPVLRRRRRRLVLVSAPLAVLLVLLAVRLVLLGPVHHQTLTAYEDGDARRTLTWAGRQGWLNVVERFRAPFAVGDAHILAGDFDLARPSFEVALEQVPKGGIDECRVRVNLGLTYERLGDVAKARERTAEWRQYYDKGIETTRNRPPLCDLPDEGRGTGQQLREAQQRMEEKNGDRAPDPQPDGGTPAPAPPAPVPDPGRTPSQEQQDALREQQKRNTIERNQQRGSDSERPGGGAPSYPKPW